MISLHSNKIGMPLHDKAFWIVFFFLVGVLLASVGIDSIQRLVMILLVGVFFIMVILLFRRKWFAILSIFIFIGAGYYFLHDMIQKNVEIPFGETEVTGLIREVAVGESRQTITASLESPHKGKIRIITGKYPEWHYGDVVTFTGAISNLPKKAINYFEKEGIFGVMEYPLMERIASGEGSGIKRTLISIKQFTENQFARVLPHNESVFLSGLVLGETAPFSYEFREAMSITGTSHLVALSGYNVTIIAKAMIVLIGMWFSRKSTFILSTFAIAAFVIMTGADVTVVRAAIMAFLVLLASQSERGYSIRNAIIIAAWIMVLFNPKILLWDIGFQLSFVALLGLVYLKPALTYFLKLPHGPGFFGWRENLLTTTSAQLAVLPILIGTFGTFSPVSLITNVLILTVVPITMLFGFFIVFTSLISSYLALFIGWITRVFLSYEIGVINIFSQFDGALWQPKFSLPLSFIYYILLGMLIIVAMRRKRHEKEPIYI